MINTATAPFAEMNDRASWIPPEAGSSGSGGFNPVGAALSGGGALASLLTAGMKLSNFKQHIKSQQADIEISSQAIVAQRDQQQYDLKRRASFIDGSITAATGAGVSTDSGSITNSLADLAGQTAIDKFRIDFNANVQLAQNTLKSNEIDRQSKAATKIATVEGIGSAFQLGASVAGAFI